MSDSAVEAGGVGVEAVEVGAVTPFRVAVPDAVLDDLRDRLARTRWPDPAPGAPWALGTDLAYLQELCRYWRDEFDWRAVEAELNRFPQYTVTAGVDGGTADGSDQLVHFLHVRSPHPDAMPLIITHGWPGSVWEFHKIIGPLADPTTHGGRASDAFHVVCPSIPGYGFSGPTTAPAWDTERVARTNMALMARLGYDRYGAQGGDWGSIISRWMGGLDGTDGIGSHVIGVHLNMLGAGPPDRADRSAGLNPEELAAIADMDEFRRHETAYQQIQGTKPQTLAYGLTDSPAGLAGWIVEKFRTWSDCGGDVERRFTKDELLANITIYWVTSTINASTRLYYEALGPGRSKRAPKVAVPVGHAQFPGELYRPPRAWAERHYNITHWQRYDEGGHFAALEVPDLLVDDIRAFFRTLR